MSDSRTKKVKRNVISSLCLKVATITLQFISRMIFVRVLDQSLLGINGLFSNIIGVLSLADLGISTAIMYSLYKPISENNEEKIGQLIKFFKKIYFIIATTIGVIGIALMPFLKYIINIDTQINHLEVYYLLFLSNTIISYLFVYRTALLDADQKSYIINKYNIIFQVVTFVAQIITLILFKNYILYILTGVICAFINNLMLNNITLKLYPFLKLTKGNLELKEKKVIFENVKSLFIYRLCSVVQGNTDSILISIFVGTIIVGHYSNYSMLIVSITTFVALVFSSVKASIGNLVAENIDNEKKYFVFNVLELVNFWIVAFCAICFCVLFQDFIVLAFGKQYLMSFGAVIVIVLNFYTSNIRQSIWAYRETTGIFKKTKYITMYTAIINLFLSLLLAYKFGLIGILGATVIARMIYAFWKEPIILYRDVFNKPVKGYFLRYFYNLLLLAITMGITIFISNILVDADMYIKFIYKIGTCILVPNIIFLIIFCKTVEFKYLIERLEIPIVKQCSNMH